MSAGRSAEHDHEKQQHGGSRQKVEPPKTSLFCASLHFLLLPFGSTSLFLLCFGHSGNTIQIVLPEKTKKKKRRRRRRRRGSNHYTLQMKKCGAVKYVGELLLLHSNPHHTEAQRNTGLVWLPVASGRPATRDITFKYRLLAIMEEKKSWAV